jgi:hypothetical protein
MARENTVGGYVVCHLLQNAGVKLTDNSLWRVHFRYKTAMADPEDVESPAASTLRRWKTPVG